MRPTLNASFPIHIPGVRLSVPLEVKVVENVATFNGEKLGEVVLPEPTPAAPEVVEAAAVEPLVADEVVAEAPAAEAEEAPAASDELTWSGTMTKTELLAIAQQLGLPVTSSNTKAEILSALDATKQ